MIRTSLAHFSFGSSFRENHSGSNRGAAVHSHFRPLQRCSTGFRSGLCLGHHDFHRVFPKPLLCFLGPILQGIVMLKCKPLPQPEILSTFFFFFTPRIAPYFSASIFPSIRTSHSVPVTDKHPLSMMLPPPCLTVGMWS